MNKLIFGLTAAGLLNIANILNAGFEPDNWPDQFSNGAFTVDPVGENEQAVIDKYPSAINALCTYSEGQADWIGDPLNGGELKIKFPKPVFNIVNFSYTQKGQVVPVILIYTANYSQNTATFLCDFIEDNMAKHFVNLIIDSQLMGYLHSKYPDKPVSSIVINPDMFSELQKQLGVADSSKRDTNIWTADDVNNFMKAKSGSTLKVKDALKKALYFTDKKLLWKTDQLTPIGIVAKVCESSIGKTSPINWQATEDFKTLIKNEYISIKAADYQNYAIPPEITDDFTGYIQAVNYIVSEKSKYDLNGTYTGKRVTYGWASNNWLVSYGVNLQGAQWIHTNPLAAKIKTYASQLSDTWKNWGIYSGKWPGDFIALDKYERNAFYQITGKDVLSEGWLWNQQEWLDYLLFIKNVTVSLNKPALLFQIPGGHLAANVPIADRNKMSTEPQFFFGDSSFDISNVKNLSLNTANYGDSNGKLTIEQFLNKGHTNELNGDHGSSAAADWQTSHLREAIKANVFGIIWGGGNTTSIGNYPTDYSDNGWLASKIEQNPIQQPLPDFNK